jgi:hypothetical protein
MIRTLFIGRVTEGVFRLRHEDRVKRFGLKWEDSRSKRSEIDYTIYDSAAGVHPKVVQEAWATPRLLSPLTSTHTSCRALQRDAAKEMGEALFGAV